MYIYIYFTRTLYIIIICMLNLYTFGNKHSNYGENLKINDCLLSSEFVYE